MISINRAAFGGDEAAGRLRARAVAPVVDCGPDPYWLLPARSLFEC
jgi:hypothetical protein